MHINTSHLDVPTVKQYYSASQTEVSAVPVRCTIYVKILFTVNKFVHNYESWSHNIINYSGDILYYGFDPSLIPTYVVGPAVYPDFPAVIYLFYSVQ